MSGEYKDANPDAFGVAPEGPTRLSERATVQAHGDVGEQLRAARKAKGLKLADVSERSGIDIATISRVERGLGRMTLETLDRLALALDMNARFQLEPIALDGAA